MNKLKTVLFIITLSITPYIFGLSYEHILPSPPKENDEGWEKIYPISDGKPFKKFHLLISKESANIGILQINLHRFLEQGENGLQEYFYRLYGTNSFPTGFSLNYLQFLRIMLTLSQMDVMSIMNSNSIEAIEIDPDIIISGFKKAFLGVYKIYFSLGDKKDMFSVSDVSFNIKDLKLKRLLDKMHEAGIIFDKFRKIKSKN